MITFVSNDDDWEGVYINGELAAEGHSISAQDLADVLSLEFQSIYVSNEWLGDEVGNLPENINDIPKEVVL